MYIFFILGVIIQYYIFILLFKSYQFGPLRATSGWFFYPFNKPHPVVFCHFLLLIVAWRLGPPLSLSLHLAPSSVTSGISSPLDFPYGWLWSVFCGALKSENATAQLCLSPRQLNSHAESPGVLLPNLLPLWFAGSSGRGGASITMVLWCSFSREQDPGS
jgi:hypothetical protein